jgi:DNA-nicking Smr family endonuclease
MSAGGQRGPGRGRRALTAEERALWRGIARSIKPLRGRAARAPPDDEPDEGHGVPAPVPPKAHVKTSMKTSAQASLKPKPVAPPVKPSAPPLAGLARREKQKLARGSAAIDARIDLHGMTQAEAHAALAHFLRRAQRNGARFVLVITGKGTRAGERGVLRRQVPLWLGLPEFRDAVVGFEEAHVAHGGEGALYVRMRRARAET